MRHFTVQRTPELLRIEGLPRRNWLEDIDSLIGPLSKHLILPGHVCAPGGCAVLNGIPVTVLRAIQAAGLAEAHDYGGAFMQAGVGDGKTLLSMLFGVIWESDKILLVVPASMREDTVNKFRVLREHWSFLPIRIESFEHFGRDDAKDTLPKYFANARKPVIIFDEVQFLKARTSGRTKKFDRFISDWRGAGKPLHIAAMTGSMASRSLRDFEHILEWCFPESTPLPRNGDLSAWCSAVDEHTDPNATRTEPGALLRFCTPKEIADNAPTTAATIGVGRRIFETPGVIASQHRNITIPLNVRCVQVDLAGTPEDEAFSFIRGISGDPDRLGWETPDRHPIADGVALWRHARELALGFFYKWAPQPEKAWLEARREWCAAVRKELSTNHRELDTEFQVAKEISLAVNGRVCPTCRKRLTKATCNGVDDKAPPENWDEYRDEDELEDFEEAAEAYSRAKHKRVDTTPAPRAHKAEKEWRAWHAIKDTFTPKTVPVWVGDTALEYAADWGRRNVGIIWTEHTAFAEELARRTGLRLYGRGGLDSQRRPIEGADPTKSLIATLQSNHRGRNLQAWNKSLVTSFPPTGTIVEQLLGREHRPGQRAASVDAEVMIACQEQLAGFERARADCTWHKHMLTTQPKLSSAVITVPIMRRDGYAWASALRKDKARGAQINAAIEALRPTG